MLKCEIDYVLEHSSVPSIKKKKSNPGCSLIYIYGHLGKGGENLDQCVGLFHSMFVFDVYHFTAYPLPVLMGRAKSFMTQCSLLVVYLDAS